MGYVIKTAFSNPDIWGLIGSSFAFLMMFVCAISGLIRKDTKSSSRWTWVITALCALVFGTLFAFKELTIPTAQVEEDWKKYEQFCKEEGYSFYEFTYPDWLYYGPYSAGNDSPDSYQDW